MYRCLSIYTPIRTYCKDCSRETTPSNRQCFGHGGGGKGGGGGGSGSGEKAGAEYSKVPAKGMGIAIDLGGNAANVSTQTVGRNISAQGLNLSGKGFNQDVISDLFTFNVLKMNNDKESGILTFRLSVDPKSLSQEKREEWNNFVKSVIQELDAFPKGKIDVADCISIKKDAAGKNIISLQITLPTPTMYDAFILQLANHPLNPLSTKPTPTINKNSDKTMEDVESLKRHQEMIQPRSPKDGPTPES